MDEKFGQHCIVEVMGRVRLAGFVSEQVIAGQGFIRVDVPAVGKRGAFTRFFGPSSIYGMTPVSEEVAKTVAAGIHAAPVEAWEFPRLAKPSADPGQGSEDDPGDLAGAGDDDGVMD